MKKKDFGENIAKNDISSKEPLIKSKKVTSNRDFQFDNITKKNEVKMGRPLLYNDPRFKATMPKRVSPNVNIKIEALKPLMNEFIKDNGNPTFNEVIDVLIECYINQRLSKDKVEYLRNEITENMKKL